MPARKPPTKQVCVALVEAHGCLREGLAAILERSGYRITVSVDEADALAEALNAGAQVDLVILNVNLPAADEVSPLCALHATRPALQAIALVQTVDDGIVVWAFKNGARAIVARSMGPAELVAAVETVARVGVYHTVETQRILLENPDGLSAEELTRKKLLAQLPDWALDVLRLICHVDDLTYEQMARELKMNRRTVEDYVEQLRDVFGVRSKTALALAAIRLKIVTL